MVVLALLYSQTFIEHCLPRLMRGITRMLQIYTDKDKNLCKSIVSVSPVRLLTDQRSITTRDELFRLSGNSTNGIRFSK